MSANRKQKRASVKPPPSSDDARYEALGREVERRPIGGHGSVRAKDAQTQEPVMTEGDAVREDMQGRARKLVGKWRASKYHVFWECAAELSTTFGLDDLPKKEARCD